MLFAGREVRIGENCARGLKNCFPLILRKFEDGTLGVTQLERPKIR